MKSERLKEYEYTGEERMVNRSERVGLGLGLAQRGQSTIFWNSGGGVASKTGANNERAHSEINE